MLRPRCDLCKTLPRPLCNLSVIAIFFSPGEVAARSQVLSDQGLTLCKCKDWSGPLSCFECYCCISVLFCLIVDAGQICASCTDTEGQDTCQHHIECADDEVGV